VVICDGYVSLLIDLLYVYTLFPEQCECQISFYSFFSFDLIVDVGLLPCIAVDFQVVILLEC